MNTIVRETCDLYRVDLSSVKKIADGFNEELDRALAGQKSSLKILPSFLSAPTGREKGNYIAIDFGGSNVRVTLVRLKGKGSYEILKQTSRLLKDPQGRYDYTTAHTSGREVFAFVADLVAEVLAGAWPDKLGLTFSYPMHQNSVSSARLIRWTKELKPSQTIGRDIGKMLEEALKNRGIIIKPAAIINDTVAVFLAGRYYDSGVCAGSICGTGHNTCYLEMSGRTADMPGMVVNTEAGNFSLLPGNCYDHVLDQETEDPGQQKLEKMVSGKYLGELLRITMRDLGEKGVLLAYSPSSSIWNQPFSLSTEVLGWLQSEDYEGKVLLDWIEKNGIDVEDYAVFKLVSTAILDRAMKLIAATFVAILERTPQFNTERRVIAVDGALFYHIPGFSQSIQNILQGEMKDFGIALLGMPNGSNVGAAVAAAMAKDII